MFDNIGQKIKSVAVTVLCVGIIASFIVGLITLFSGEDWAFYGIFIIVIGVILSWVCSLMTYGYGQLIENSDKLVSQNKPVIKTQKSYDKATKSVSVQKNNNAHKWRCEKCGNMISENTCPYCATRDYKICNYCKNQVPIEQERCECGCINFS